MTGGAKLDASNINHVYWGKRACGVALVWNMLPLGNSTSPHAPLELLLFRVLPCLFLALLEDACIT